MTLLFFNLKKITLLLYCKTSTNKFFTLKKNALCGVVFVCSIIAHIISAQAQTQQVPTDTLKKDTTTSKIPKNATQIQAQKATWRSAVLPGWGQAYNHNYWKTPIIATCFTASLVNAIHYKKKYNEQNAQYKTLLNTTDTTLTPNYTQTLTTTISEQKKYNTAYKGFIAATAISYLWNIADASINPHLQATPHHTHSSLRAAYYSALLPGLGQYYNRKYWKIPIIYAGFAATSYFIYTNHNSLNLYKTEYLARTRIGYGQPSNDFTIKNLSNDQILQLKNISQRYYELSIIGTSLWYALNILDAVVDAHLHNFDISNDLSLHLQPYYLPPTLTTNNNNQQAGIKLFFTF